MLVVIEVVSIPSENVTVMLSLIETPLWLSAGEVKETVGGVVSVLVLLDEPPPLLLQEMMVRLKRSMEKMTSICLTSFPISVLGEPELYHHLV